VALIKSKLRNHTCESIYVQKADMLQWISSNGIYATAFRIRHIYTMADDEQLGNLPAYCL